jgi:FkbM family methyltransferase
MNALSNEVISSLHHFEAGNQDGLRFKVDRGVTRALKNALKRFLLRFGFVHLPRAGQQKAADLVNFLIEHEERISDFYDVLDAKSRDILVKLLAFRLLGAEKVRLPRNDDRYRLEVAKPERHLVERNVASVPVLGSLNLYELPVFGETIRLIAHPLNILNTFVLRQYELSRGQNHVAVRSGDLVLDAGACWGDTTLYFAAAAGHEGRVIAVEPIAKNLALLERNLAMNPQLAARVTVVRQATARRSGDLISMSEQGASSSVGSDETVTSISIDDLVRQTGLPRVDFIKMDIEGAELDSLIGATETLKKDRPRLAISAYHRLTDFSDIPAFLTSLDLNYELALDHFTIHQEETVLFAHPRA